MGSATAPPIQYPMFDGSVKAQRYGKSRDGKSRVFRDKDCSLSTKRLQSSGRKTAVFPGADFTGGRAGLQAPFFNTSVTEGGDAFGREKPIFAGSAR